jgi:glycerol-3-phosphate acyltransferase PlsY
LTALGAYLLGSIPTGFLVAKAKGIDIRNVGSGNIGATNAMRVLGKPAGIFVLLADAAKGYAAVVWLTPMLFNQLCVWLHHFFSAMYDYFQYQPVEIQTRFFVLAGVCAVLGHNYTCWLKFKGGKGIATTAGVYLALAPWPLLIALAVFLLAVIVTRYMSVGSIAGAIALPTAVWISQPHNYFLGIVTTALGALAIYKHKSNIQRLMAGTENRLGKKSVGQASSLSQTPNPNEKNGDRQDACPTKSEGVK